MSALSGLDQALWDLKGQALGLPAWQLIGGRVRDRIRALCLDRRRPAARDRRRAPASGASQGFSAVKMNATAELDWIGTPKAFDEVIERVKAAQAEGMDVGLDFHGRVHRPMAKQLAKALEPLGLLFIEEPLLSENHEGLAQIAQLVSTPIALGERLYSRWDFKPFFEGGAVDIIQPDLSHAGGLSECRRIAAMAEAYDVAVAPHCPLGPLALAACLQLAATAPNVAHPGDVARHPLQCRPRSARVLTNKEVLTPVDGYLPIPRRPGPRRRRSTRRRCAKPTRTAIAGATRSGASRTAASRSGEMHILPCILQGRGDRAQRGGGGERERALAD